jgi:hypothetical protein
VTKQDYAILKLLEEAIDTRNAEAIVVLWRRFAKWHGLNPDFAVVLQKRQAQDAAGFTVAECIRAMVAEQPSSSN